ncbi:Transcriptional regulator, contains HTH domain [Halalkaliarchaeum sp. AArc-CO]|uniref:helix-turn-helix domain-containing protein n=1 Tax=unclassified Halalkaliarchaeum TaxID=2678344 RepID=UPI00217E6787|nr:MULTISPECIES: helix-turn-helix domain-containing protein [unclassified Halalkaliarchaeum]MDR5674096.1 helix-turn-helix domain-containing protein [Halalkaliarchaeum sp. AArc-GB]UWG50815.1 Transcriptional regulator, contains HTH domain [Halalkaliarchaeum sp. AArc-CO]
MPDHSSPVDAHYRLESRREDMTQARLNVTLPPGPWIAEISRRHPEVTFRVLTAIPAEGRGIALVQIHAPDPDAILAEVTDHETVIDCSTLQRTEATATIQIETATPVILPAAKQAGISVEMPVEIRDGVATVDVAGAHEKLSALGEQFEAMGLEFDVEYVHERRHPEQLLTYRQQEVLRTAVEMGYYDTPRKCTLTELAEELAIAKSTCSDILHRIEETIVKQFLEDLPPLIGGDAETTESARIRRE